MNTTFIASFAAAAVLGVAAWGVHHSGVETGDAAGYKRGHAEAVDVQSRWDADRARMAQAASAAESLHAQEHQSIVDNQEKTEHDAEIATQQRDAARADAADLRRSLHDAARALAAANPGGGGSSADPAAVAGRGLPAGAGHLPAAGPGVGAGPERAIDRIADVLDGADSAAGDLADFADALRASLGACRREYDNARTVTNGG